MSISYGAIGSVITAANVAWTTYKSCKAAPGSFNNISAEVLSFHAVLKEVEETLAGQKLSPLREQRLETITQGCNSVLKDIQAVVKNYESLGTQSKRTWDRLNWNAGEISELRARLTSNTVLLSTFMSTCQFVVEQKLDRLLQEFQEGKHEGSVLSVVTVDSLAQDEKDAWRTIRKELEDIGISVAAFDANKHFIMEWFQRALSEGFFEEQPISGGIDAHSDGGSLGESSQTERDLSTEMRKEDVKAMVAPHPVISKPRPSSPVLILSSLPSRIFWEDPKEIEHPIQKKPLVARAHSRSTTAPLLIRVLRGYNDQFIQACFEGNLEKARQLWEKGANANARYTRDTKDSRKHRLRKGATALGMAASTGNESVASWLLDHGADINGQGSDGDTPLHLASLAISKEEMVQFLLYHGANPNVEWSSGETPLVTAVDRGFETVAKLLLQYGALCNIDHLREPLLILAIRRNHRGLVRLLLDYHAEITPSEVWNALFAAVRSGEATMVRLLLDYGADVNWSNRTSYSALSVAVAVDEKEIEIIRLLLDYGADVKAAKIGSESVLDYVARENLTEIEKMLVGATQRDD